MIIIKVIVELNIVLQFCSTIRNNIWPEGGKIEFYLSQILLEMKRLSLEELKAKKTEQVKENLEEIKGGKMADCHWSFRDFAIGFGLWLGIA